jgi:ubiquinol-cytochrome c reductase cytochrome b subunit
VVYLFLPWLDRSPVKSMRYKGMLSRSFFALFILSFLGLMYAGLNPPEPKFVWIGRLSTIGYFLYFILMPFYTRAERVKPVPQRLTYHAHS